MVKKLFYLPIIFCIILLVFSCSKSPVERESTASIAQSRAIPLKFLEIKFSVPESISEKINDLAAERAMKLGCDGLRILQAKMKNGAIKYHILFFIETTKNEISEAFISSEGAFEEIPSQEWGYVSALWSKKHQSLKKSFAADTDTECLNLAYFYADAHYGGNSFLVTQLANAETGYFHKLIYCLGTSSCLVQCAGTFPGGFNNLLSSHQWPSFAFYGNQLATKPDLIRVYNGTNLGSLLHTFSGTDSDHDSNWSDNNCNNAASSLRLQYWIEVN